jgi:Zn-dependent peptidase ImmA (M78 family)
MHEGPSPNIEDEANSFGAEFLMPRREIRGALYALNMAKLADHKRHWKVSMAALIQRAFELKTITDSQRRYLFINLTRRSGTRLHEPFEADVPREKPQLFGKIIRQHLTELGFSVRELAKMLFFENESEFRADILGEQNLRLV